MDIQLRKEETLGCVNACICSGNCLRCGTRKQEEYIGQAEDLYDYLHGRDFLTEEQKQLEKRQEQEYYEEMYAKYEQEMQEMFEKGENNDKTRN